MQQETDWSHLDVWYDAASDHSVAEHLLAGVEKCGKVNKRDRKSFGSRWTVGLGILSVPLITLHLIAVR